MTQTLSGRIRPRGLTDPRATSEICIRFRRNLELSRSRTIRAPEGKGLIVVNNAGRVGVMEGGSLGARWFRLVITDLRPRSAGLKKRTDAEVNHKLELLAGPNKTTFHRSWL